MWNVDASQLSLKLFYYVHTSSNPTSSPCHTVIVPKSTMKLNSPNVALPPSFPPPARAGTRHDPSISKIKSGGLMQQ